MACLAQSAAGAKDALFLLHTHAHKVGHPTVMGAKVKQQGQPTDAPFDVFDMRDHPKNRDREGDCKWRCDNHSRCARYEFDAITLICNMFEESKDKQSAPFDVFDMRDHKKNRDNEADCKWRCDNNYRCARYAYDASTLFCKLFEKSTADSGQGVPAYDVFDMRDHKKNRDNQGDCKWRCDNNYRCARYEYDASTLFCKLFEKSKDDSHQSAPFDVFDMRDHPKNRDHEGDCKWKCNNDDRCDRYEYDATTLICKMFEKYHVDQEDKDTSGEDVKDAQVLVAKKAKSGFGHNSEKDDKEDDDNDDKKSKKGFKHKSDKGDKDISDKNAEDDKDKKKSKHGLKSNSDEDDKKTKKDHEAKKSPDSVSDKHDKHSKNKP